MRQSGAEALVTEEPYALIAHVRVCGGAGWVTTGSTRKLTAHSAGLVVVPGLGGCGPQLSGSVRCQRLRAVRCSSLQTSGWMHRYCAEHAVSILRTFFE